MSAKVYYHIKADQLVIVCPEFKEGLRQTGVFAFQTTYSQCRHALEGPYVTLLVLQSYLEKECVEIGDFDEDQP